LLSSVNINENNEDSRLANTDVKNAVVFSAQVLDEHRKLLPQYGLLGEVLSGGREAMVDPRLFLNTNHPFSVFLCGLQGAGKSHSLSCLLGEVSCGRSRQILC
jgi:signal recognition particle GTPase